MKINLTQAELDHANRIYLSLSDLPIARAKLVLQEALNLVKDLTALIEEKKTIAEVSSDDR